MKNSFKQGFAGTLTRNYSTPIMYLMILFSFNLMLNIVTHIPEAIHESNMVSTILFLTVALFSVAFLMLCFSSLVFFTHKDFTLLIKYLIIIALVTMIVPFLVMQDWFSILKSTFIPTLKCDKNFLLILVAVFLTTLSPYLFFKKVPIN